MKSSKEKQDTIVLFTCKVSDSALTCSQPSPEQNLEIIATDQTTIKRAPDSRKCPIPECLDHLDPDRGINITSLNELETLDQGHDLIYQFAMPSVFETWRYF